MVAPDTWVVVRWRKRVFAGLVKQSAPHPDPDAGMIVEVDASWGRVTLVVGGAAAPPVAESGRRGGTRAGGVRCSSQEFDIAADQSGIFVIDPVTAAGASLDHAHGGRHERSVA